MSSFLQQLHRFLTFYISPRWNSLVLDQFSILPTLKSLCLSQYIDWDGNSYNYYLTIRIEKQHKEMFKLDNCWHDVDRNQVRLQNYLCWNTLLSNYFVMCNWKILRIVVLNSRESAKNVLKKFRFSRKCTHIGILKADFCFLKRWNIYTAFKSAMSGVTIEYSWMNLKCETFSASYLFRMECNNCTNFGYYQNLNFTDRPFWRPLAISKSSNLYFVSPTL